MLDLILIIYMEQKITSQLIFEKSEFVVIYEIQDWSALMDTTGTLVRISMVLLIVTVVLNGINIFFYKARS